MQCSQAHQLLLVPLLLPALSACGPQCCLPVAHLACLTWMGQAGCGLALPAPLRVQRLGVHWTSAGCHYQGKMRHTPPVGLACSSSCSLLRPSLC
jgi:hypothetical protein